MSVLLFALIVLIIAGLIIYGVQQFAPVPQPFNNLICLLIVIIAAVVIAGRAGLV